MLISLAVAACGAGAASVDEYAFEIGDGGSTVVVTTSIWADITANVACLDPQLVKPLIPAGSDPHGFRPTLAHAEAIRNADLVIANGGGLEAAINDLLQDRIDDGKAVATAVDLLKPVPSNPHVWLDPVAVAEITDQLAAWLGNMSSDGRKIAQCADSYRAEIEALDTEIGVNLSKIDPANQKIVTNHETLGPFADRYGLEIVGTVLTSTSSLAEASAADLDNLRTVIESEQAKAVFVEKGHSGDELETLASQLGEVQIVTLSIESLGERGSSTATYVDMMRDNTVVIVDTLGAE